MQKNGDSEPDNSSGPSRARKCQIGWPAIGWSCLLSVEIIYFLILNKYSESTAKNGTNEQYKSKTENRHHTGKASCTYMLWREMACLVRLQHLSQPVVSLKLRIFSTILLLRNAMRILLIRWSSKVRNSNYWSLYA